METLDLDINNYDLHDILALFKLDKDFSENDLKKAKQLVLKMHPDKSRLDAKYFLFFSSAYKRLYSIYEFLKILLKNEYHKISQKNINKEQDLLNKNKKKKVRRKTILIDV